MRKNTPISQKLLRLLEPVRRAFAEFLKLPTIIIAAFLVLGAVTFFLDEASSSNQRQLSGDVPEGFFRDPQAARDFLGVIAAGVITATSITLSVLLIAVQQGASSLTSQVFDQFLRRKSNQIYFGFFIGLALYALIVLASTSAYHHPVYGLAITGFMIVVALYMLISLIYTSINQMRPAVIIKAIHDHILLARQRQQSLLHRTRRTSALKAESNTQITADNSGFITTIDVEAMVAALPARDVEIVILGSIGDYVAFGAPIAEIRTLTNHAASPALSPAIQSAIRLEAQRDLDVDPAFGVEELVTIGWTSISTAKSNPDPGMLTIWNLRDLLARWLATDPAFSDETPDDLSAAPVVYNDRLVDQLFKGFESLSVVASESMQHQTLAELYLTFASLFDRLPQFARNQVTDLIRRSLSGLGDQILTSDLEASLDALIDAIGSADMNCSEAIRTAKNRLHVSIGSLNSRSTRVKAAECPSPD